MMNLLRSSRNSALRIELTTDQRHSDFIPDEKTSKLSGREEARGREELTPIRIREEHQIHRNQSQTRMQRPRGKGISSGKKSRWEAIWLPGS